MDAEFDWLSRNGPRSQRDGASTRGSWGHYREWGIAGKAADPTCPPQTRPAGGTHRSREPGTHYHAGNGHYHAPDDGRRGATWHWQGSGESARLYIRRQNRFGADLRFKSARLHALLQRELSRLCPS